MDGFLMPCKKIAFRAGHSLQCGQIYREWSVGNIKDLIISVFNVQPHSLKSNKLYTESKHAVELNLTYPPLTRSVTVSDTESSPAVEYYRQRRKNNPQSENMLNSQVRRISTS